MKEKLLKLRKVASGVVQSDWFIVLNALLVLLGWSLKVWVPMLCVMAAINILPLFFDKNTKQVFNLLFMFSFMMSADRNDIYRFAPMLAIVAVLLVGMIFNLAFFKRNMSLLHPKNIKGFHASLIALIFPFALAGVGSPAEVPLFSVAILALVVVLGVVYSFFAACYNGTEERKALPEYVIKVLIASGIVVSLEMIIFYAKIGDINAIVQAMMAKKVHLGWAGPNNMAPLLSIAIPATLYMCIKKNFATPIFATLALIEYALIISTGCRGAILFTTLAMPAMLLYVIVKSENKISFGVTISVIFIIAVIIVAYYGDIFANILTTILNKRLESTGREELYRLAIDTFKTWPIFGAGWDYKTDYYYHGTFFQIMATMGIFGLIIFAVFYFWRYWTFFKMRKDPACVALFAGMFLFEAYGFIDTNYFIPNFFTILLLMTFAVEMNVPEKSCLAFGGKDPVAHVVGFFRILADRVKPVKAANVSETLPSANDSDKAHVDNNASSATSDIDKSSEDDASETGTNKELAPDDNLGKDETDQGTEQKQGDSKPDKKANGAKIGKKKDSSKTDKKADDPKQ